MLLSKCFVIGLFIICKPAIMAIVPGEIEFLLPGTTIPTTGLKIGLP